MKKIKVVRVGVMNNFNFTETEMNYLHNRFDDTDNVVFVNSNSFVTIKNDFPSIITINPYFTFVEPKGDISNIRACRIKYIAGAKEFYNEEFYKAVDWCVENNIKILITFQRFRSHKTLNEYVHEINKFNFEKGWFRVVKEEKLKTKKCLEAYISSMKPVTKNILHFCDFKGVGCSGCNNCIKLVTNKTKTSNYDIYGMNLSCSGDSGKCLFNCPDCFAKKLLAFTKTKTPKCDIVYKNGKQKNKEND